MVTPAVPSPLPSLTALDGQQQLLVDGRPFLILGGELHNSSTSTSRAIRTAFATLTDRNFNTVLAPVAWDVIEPLEGEYDFTLVDELLDAARASGHRLIPLWFGAWKNGRSTYVPEWVRTDLQRFPRAELRSDSNREHISPFGEAIRGADAQAFGALMKHLRETDSEQRTVIMVQVENEVGILGDSRDRSPAASAEFAAEVPGKVYQAIAGQTNCPISSAWEAHGRLVQGDWVSVFGDSPDTDEAFMAVAYASHVEAVVAAGKAEYPLPMFANAWLYTDIEVTADTPAGGQQPGIYPSGGPVPRVAALWRQFAPSLDLVTPDIYFGSFTDICRDYVAASGGLFIPEMRRDEQGAADAFLAIGNHGAIGVSPFGVDSVTGDEGDALSDAYRLLTSVAPLVAGHETVGLHLTEEHPRAEVTIGGYKMSARRQPGSGASEPEGRGYGIVIHAGQGQFIAAGRGLHLAFRSADDRHVEIARAEEVAGRYPEFETTRVLNGDETQSGTVVILHSLSESISNAYRIPVSPPGNGLVRFRLYTVT